MNRCLSWTRLFPCLVLLSSSVVFGAHAQTQPGATLQGGAGAGHSEPDAPTASLAEVQRLLNNGRSEDALKRADLLDTETPRAAGLDRIRGQILYALNRFPEADAAFVRAMAADPSDQQAIQMRGLTLFRLGRPADAIPLLERAHAWNAETRVDPSYVLALCYIDARRYDDARHAFAAQYGFVPDGAAAHLLAARMLLRREYVPVAQAEARKALELEPELPLAHFLLGEVALAGEHLDEAINEFELESKRDPLFGGVYDRLGDAYSRKGSFVQAQQALQRALLLEPTTTAPYILLGKVLLKRQDPVSAAGYLERAERMDSGNYITHFLLGQAYRGLGRTDDARRESELAQKLQGDSAPKLDAPKQN